MMTLNASKIEPNPIRHADVYRNDWDSFVANQSRNGSASDRAHELRRVGWEEFNRIGFPINRRGNELWKYTDLRQIDRMPFRFGAPSSGISLEAIAKMVPLPREWQNVVFVDGVRDPSIADSGSQSDGLTLRDVTAYEQLGALAGCESNAFVSLNSAFLDDGLMVDIDHDVESIKPLHVVFVSTGSDLGQRAVYPRIAVSVGRGSHATLIETHVSMADGSHLSVPVVEISMGQQSTLRHYRVQLDGEDSYHFATTRVKQGEDSRYRSTSFSMGSSIGRHDVLTMLDGEHAESTLHGVYMTTNRQHQDFEISTTHSVPHGTSDQYYKGILSGRSRAVFSGKITVERGAQKTDANQKDLNLLLSHGAEVDTKPSLEIYADDVKCAHGATAGHVDEDTLFYLQSRGVDYDTAQAMLIRGFAAEILDEIEDELLRTFLEDKLDELMPALQQASDTIGTA